jgi:2-polyprenyl-3-methyl-5-hydroxy-6-metoxy-1,4-benzoquinol methylase
LLGAFYNTEGYDCHDPAFDAASSPRSDAVRLDLVQSAVESRSPFLLDIGPGAGHLLRHARERGWRVAGLEVGRPARERLEQQGVSTYADLDAWHAAAQQADVVTMVHVLEHMTEPAATLQRVHRDALRRGGVCYIEVPNVDSLRARLAVSFLRPLWRSNAGRYLAFPIHLTYFNHRALRRLLRAQGFEILRMGTLGLGVDELFALPSTGYPASRDGRTAPAARISEERGDRARTPSAADSTPVLIAAARRTIGRAVKSAMSRARLGEHLYAICRA